MEAAARQWLARNGYLVVYEDLPNLLGGRCVEGTRIMPGSAPMAEHEVVVLLGSLDRYETGELAAQMARALRWRDRARDKRAIIMMAEAGFTSSYAPELGRACVVWSTMSGARST